MSKEHEKIKYLSQEKSLKVLFIIHADLESLLKRVRYCQNNPENSYTQKKVKHKPSGYAWCATRYFYRGKDCIENFCNYLKELGTEIINFEGKEMMPLTNKEIKSYEKQKYAIYVKKNFVTIKTTKKS